MSGPLKSTFCSIETVSCITGLPVDHLYELVESGNYLWVWNVSTGVGFRRELRFWSREINNPATVLNLSLDAAITAIIPRRVHMTGQQNGLCNWEFRQLLRISKCTLSRLRHELGVTGIERDLFIPRASLENFFRRRWLGNILIRNCPLQPNAAPLALNQCV